MCKIYHVQGGGVDRLYHIAFATGDVADIREFYVDKAGYGIEITEIRPVHISPEMTATKVALQAEKARISARLQEIEKLLR